MGRYLDLCSTVEVDAIEPASPRDKSDKSDQSPSASKVPSINRPVIEGGSEPAAPAEWSPQDWRGHYSERAAIIEFDGELPRPEAKRLALDDTVSQWLTQHPPPATDDAAGCVHCGAVLDDAAVPVLAGDSGHTWLHGRCHHDWLAERRGLAAEALREMGVEAARW